MDNYNHNQYYIFTILVGIGPYFWILKKLDKHVIFLQSNFKIIFNKNFNLIEE